MSVAETQGQGRVPAGRSLRIYLNDHLAGATLGSGLARQIRDHTDDAELNALMRSLAPQIEEDRRALIGMMRRTGSSINPVKQALGWVTERLTRVMFRRRTAGSPTLSAFLEIESLTLGVGGKTSLWTALSEVVDQHAGLRAMELDELIDRARTQYELLEHARLAAARRAFGAAPETE